MQDSQELRRKLQEGLRKASSTCRIDFQSPFPPIVLELAHLEKATMQLVLPFLVFCLTLASFSLGQVFIPAKMNGFSLLGDRSEINITVEIFCDLLCPDCKQLWPTVEAVMECGLGYLNVVFNGFPLPYHRNAMLAYTGLRIALENPRGPKLTPGGSALRACVSRLFENQAYVKAPRTDSMTEEEAKKAVAEYIYRSCQVDVGDALMHRYASYEAEAIADFKYSATRNVAATPTVIVNGIHAPIFASLNYKQWLSSLDQLHRGKSLPTDAFHYSDHPLPRCSHR